MTLHKWIERFCMGGLQYGFITWRQKSDKLKHRVSVLQSVRRHLVLHQLKLAWFRWQEASANLIMGDNSEYLKRVEYLTQEQQSKNQFNEEKHLERTDDLRLRKKPYTDEMSVIQKKLTACFEMIISRKDSNYSEFALRHLLKRWYQHAHSVTRACKAIETGVAKLMLQSGFTSIRDAVRER